MALLLVRSSSDLNTQNDKGDTALHIACIIPSVDNLSSSKTNILCSKLKIMTILLEAGASPNLQNQLGYSVLHSLFVYGGIAGLGMDVATIRDVVLLLLEYNANASLEDFEGCTPLHHAVREPNVASVVELLLQAGADVNAKDRRGMTSLHYIFDLDDEEMTNLLLHYGGSINEKDINGTTVLSYAALEGNKFMIELLLKDPRTEINLEDLNGITPLHQAAAYKYIEVCEILVAYGADVNARDAWNATPLHYAAYGGTPEIVSLLLLANASHQTKDDSGYLPIQYALDRHYFYTALAFGEEYEQEVKAHLSTSEKIDETTELQDWVLQSLPADDVLTMIVPASKVYSDPYNKDILPADTIDYVKTKTNQNSSTFVRGMTEVPGIGRIPDIEEARAIKAAVENYVEKVASTMAEIDPRFRGSLLCSGSVYEGTKICDPDEFDYMLCLEKFNQVCSVELDEATQFDNIRVSKAASSLGNNHFDDFFDEEDQLQSNNVMTAFVEIARKAISKLGFTTDSSNLYFQSLTEHTLIEGTWVLSGTVTCNLQFLWNGPYYKQLVICVDLVPAIPISNWPSPARKKGVLLTDNITSKGCHVVSKAGYWRLSFSLAEKMIMEGLSNEQKLAFVGAKVMLHAAVSAKITIYDDTTLEEATDVSNQDISKLQQDGGLNAGDKHELTFDDGSSSCFDAKSFPPDEMQTNSQNVSASSDTKAKGPDFSGTIIGRMMTSYGSPVTVIKASDKQVLQNLDVGNRVEVTVRENQVPGGIDNYRSGVGIPRIKEIGDASKAKGHDVGDGVMNDNREGNAKARAGDKLEDHISHMENTDDASAEGQGVCAMSDETVESSRVKLGDVTDVDLRQGQSTTIEFEGDVSGMEKMDASTMELDHNVGDTHENVAETRDMADIFVTAGQSDFQADDENQSNSDIPTKTFEPRDVLSTYLLKMVFFHCLEENSNISPEMVVTTEQIVRQLYDCLKDKKPLPYYFMQSHDLMDKMLQSEELCETKLTLMMLHTFLTQKP